MGTPTDVHKPVHVDGLSQFFQRFSPKTCRRAFSPLQTSARKFHDATERQPLVRDENVLAATRIVACHNHVHPDIETALRVVRLGGSNHFSFSWRARDFVHHKPSFLHGAPNIAFGAIRHELSSRLQGKPHAVHGSRRPKFRLGCRGKRIKEHYIVGLLHQGRFEYPCAFSLKRHVGVRPCAFLVHRAEDLLRHPCEFRVPQGLHFIPRQWVRLQAVHDNVGPAFRRPKPNIQDVQPCPKPHFQDVQRSPCTTVHGGLHPHVPKHVPRFTPSAMHAVVMHPQILSMQGFAAVFGLLHVHTTKFGCPRRCCPHSDLKTPRWPPGQTAQSRVARDPRHRWSAAKPSVLPPPSSRSKTS